MLLLFGNWLEKEALELPNVCRFGKYIIFFWSRENGEPIHVHVCVGTPHANATKIWMNGMVRLEHNKSHIPEKDLNTIMRWLVANRKMIETKWNQHFNNK